MTKSTYGRNQPLRTPYPRSYSATTGRAASAIFSDGQSTSGWTNAGAIESQVPSGFEGRDRRATQNATPVRKRAFTDKHEG
jgi:hypothetical protein